MNHSSWQHVAKKLIELLTSLGFLATLTFFLLRLLPGGPFDDDAALNPLVRERLQEHWGTSQNFFWQILDYLAALCRGDLGISMVRPDQSVLDIILQGLAKTFLLNSLALFVVVLGALALATSAIYWKDTWFEKSVDQLMVVLLSLPSLFWGPLLIYLFGFYWDLLPVALLEGPEYYILPVLTLSARPIASLVRLLKGSLEDNLSQDYVRTAKAKGLSAGAVLFKHILRNSWMPFLSYFGPLLVGLLSGSFLVEMLFAVPGLGTEFIQALNDRDYTVIVGLTLFYGSLLMTINTLLDLLMRQADPRLREQV